MEIDAQDDDILGALKGFMSGMGSMGASIPGADQKGPLGSLMKPDVMNSLLKDLHRIHIVILKGAPANVASFYEPTFNQQGASRMLYINDPKNPVLVLRTQNPEGITAIVQGGSDTVIARTAGMPDFKLLGKFASGMFGAFATHSQPVMLPAKAAVAPAKPAPKPAKAIKTSKAKPASMASCCSPTKK